MRGDIRGKGVCLTWPPIYIPRGAQHKDSCWQPQQVTEGFVAEVTP